MDRFDKLLARIRAAVIAGQRRVQKQDAPEHHTHLAVATHEHSRTPSRGAHARTHHERKHAARTSHTPRKGGRR